MFYTAPVGRRQPKLDISYKIKAFIMLKATCRSRCDEVRCVPPCRRQPCAGSSGCRTTCHLSRKPDTGNISISNMLEILTYRFPVVWTFLDTDTGRRYGWWGEDTLPPSPAVNTLTRPRGPGSHPALREMKCFRDKLNILLQPVFCWVPSIKIE